MLSSLPWPTRNDANSQLASYLPRVLFLHEVRVHELDHVGQRAFLASLQSNGALDVDNVCVKERSVRMQTVRASRRPSTAAASVRGGNQILGCHPRGVDGLSNILRGFQRTLPPGWPMLEAQAPRQLVVTTRAH